MSICARRVRACARCAAHASRLPVGIRARRVHTYPLRGPCIGASCAHSCAAGFRLLSPSVPPPAALTACWKRGRSVREISPPWKEFFLKFTSGNQDKPVQSSGGGIRCFRPPGRRIRPAVSIFFHRYRAARAYFPFPTVSRTKSPRFLWLKVNFLVKTNQFPLLF